MRPFITLKHPARNQVDTGSAVQVVVVTVNANYYTEKPSKLTSCYLSFSCFNANKL